MIPIQFITEWRATAPWVGDEQVEQDLVISRAIVDLFSDPLIRKTMAFRGGTALHKLVFDRQHRYSEDIDLVQVAAGPLGPTMSAIRHALAWLGAPKWKQSHGRATFYFRFQSEALPSRPMKLKVEINTREADAKLGFVDRSYRVSNRWFSGETEVRSYKLEELVSTKLRALYQRRKGRDLFDLFIALRGEGGVEHAQLLESFHHYMSFEKQTVSRAEFEKSMARKVTDAAFRGDIGPLLAPGGTFDVDKAYLIIHESLIAKLPGEPWRGEEGE